MSTAAINRSGSNKWTHPALAACTVLALAAPLPAQQFVDQTTTRFPSQPASEWSNQATIGDLDGDGDLDIVYANGGGFQTPGTPQKVRLYINDGSGFFADDSDARTGGHAGLYRGVELGDADNDGDLDIVLAQDFNRRPNLLINDGSGSFTLEGPARLPGLALSSSRAQFGDIDNDGDLDIFIMSGGSTNRFGCGQYRVFVNDGSGFFDDETTTRFPIGNVCENMDCIFGDIDNDFDIDIRTGSTGNNNSRLYRNDGTGVFTQIGAPSDSSCYSYDFGDIDGDGDLDLLGANALPGSSAELLLENNGSGSFSNVSGQISSNFNVDDNDTKFLDYDNDGDLDYVIARLGNAERIYNNDGSGNFSLTSGVIQSVTESSLDVMVADLTGNGAYDIITASGESLSPYTNRIYINNGPADTIPPSVVDTEQVDDTADSVGPYVIRALILDSMTSDRNFFDKGIFLNYSVDGGTTQQVSMRHSGGQVYRGELPGQPAGSSVSYFVTAIDFNDNVGTGATRSFSVLGVPCPSDINGDGQVDASDLALLLGSWDACPGCPADLNGDDVVDAADLALLLGSWGVCP